MKTSTINYIMGLSMLLISFGGVLATGNNTHALIGILMSNVWIVGAQILRKLND